METDSVGFTGAFGWRKGACMSACAVNPLRVCFALPGFHRVPRGAELALEAVAERLARRADFEVTVIGGGVARTDAPYRFLHAPMMDRKTFEGWRSVGPLRNEYRWEEASFLPGLWRAFRGVKSHVSVTCSYPFTSWMLRMSGVRGGTRHVFVTQNGDWPARRVNAEYRWFSCEGLVCTNPQYLQRHRERWRSALIPNGIDSCRFRPGMQERSRFGFPEGKVVVLMVSAMTAAKRVFEGLRSVAQLGDAFFLAVAGEGPLAGEFDTLANRLLPGRAMRLSVSPEQMPCLYRSCDVFLHMSVDEAFGNVFLEALSSGLPVVAHDCENTRWIFGNEDWRIRGRFQAEKQPCDENVRAYLVDTEKAEEVVEALMQASRVADGLSKAQFSKAQESRHAFVASRFSWDRSAEAYAEFLKEVALA